MHATIQPEMKSFKPRPGSWLEEYTNQTGGRFVFVSAEGEPDLIIGSIKLLRRGRYRQVNYGRAIKATSTAKTEPKMLHERHTRSLSSAVWDIRRRHRDMLGEGGMNSE